MQFLRDITLNSDGDEVISLNTNLFVNKIDAIIKDSLKSCDLFLFEISDARIVGN